MIKDNIGYDINVSKLNKNWIKVTNPKWLPRYKKAKSIIFKMKYFTYTKLLPRKLKNKLKE